MTARMIASTESTASPLPAVSPSRRSRFGTWLTILFTFIICFTAYVPLSISIAGLNLRASQMLLPVVFGWLLLQKTTLRMRLTSLMLVFLALLLWTSLLFWTLVNSDSYTALVHPLGRVFLLGLNLLHTAALYLLVSNSNRLRDTIYSWMGSVTVLNCFLLITAVGSALDIPLFRGMVNQEEAPVLVNGGFSSEIVSRFTFSGIIAGVISAATLIIVVSLVAQRNRRVPRWIWFCGLMATIGIVIGFSRQGMVSLVGGLGIVGLIMILHGRIKQLLRIILLTPLVIIPGILLINLIPGGQSFFQAFAGRTLQLFQNEAYSSGTVGSRTIMWSGMLNDVLRNPLWGNGQDNYLKYYAVIDPAGEGSHNFPLEVFHASGLVGFLAYMMFHLVIFTVVWRILFRRSTTPHDRQIMTGIIGALVAFWLSSLTNLIFTNPVYWAMLGLSVAGARLSSDNSRTQRSDSMIV